MRSELVDEVLKVWYASLESFSLSDGLNNLVGLRTSLEWVTREELPVIEHALWESSSGGGGSQSLGETERLSDWEVGLHVDEWGSSNRFLTDDNTSSGSESLKDASDDIVWGLDFAKEDWLLESWLGGKLASIEDSSASWDNLTTTSVDGISMKSDIMNIESATSHVLVAHDTFSGSPLESSLD